MKKSVSPLLDSYEIPSIEGKKFEQKAGRIDFVYLAIVVVLLGTGLLMVWSASFAKGLSSYGDGYYYIRRQLIALAIGTLFCIAFIFIPDWILAAGGIGIYLLTILLLILVYFIPTKTEHRWIYIGSFQFQPSELAKIALIVVLAFYFTKSSTFKFSSRTVRDTVFPIAITLIYVLLVIFETHLSGAVLLAIIGASMFLYGGKKQWLLLAVIVIVVAVIFVVVFFTNDYMVKRVTGTSQDEKYQETQALYAIGSGGLTGLGFGKSRQKYLYLPESQNDFIFPIACEELGFIGAVLIVVLFGFLIWRGFEISLRSKDKFRSLIAFGITVNLGAQIVFNLLVVTDILPVTGISLPFFSYGGTAIIAQMVEVGMMLHVSRYMDDGPLFPFLHKKHANADAGSDITGEDNRE